MRALDKVLPAILVPALLALAGPAAAGPCMDRITALEGRLDKEAEVAISTSSGGQGVAGAREGQAMEGTGGSPAADPAVPYQREGKEAQAVGQAAAAGEGGDKVMQAKAALNRARALDQQGDAQGCEQQVAQAESHLGGE